MKLLRKLLVAFLALIAVLAVILFTGYGTSAQVRLDTGDLRHCILGIPCSYEMMPEPERSTLLQLAKNSPILRPDWYTCAVFPLRTSNNSHYMCRGFYRDAARWAGTDATIARFAAEDIATYVITTHANYSLPECFSVLRTIDRFFNAPPDNWRTNDFVQAYCETKGYVPPPPPPEAEDGDSP